MMELIYKQEFYNIKSACIALKIELGLGFLEKVYENALKLELEERGFSVMQQYPIKVTYKNNVVGDYYADLYIVDKIIIEIKAVNEITSIHKAQMNGEGRRGLLFFSLSFCVLCGFPDRPENNKKSLNAACQNNFLIVYQLIYYTNFPTVLYILTAITATRQTRNELKFLIRSQMKHLNGTFPTISH